MTPAITAGVLGAMAVAVATLCAIGDAGLLALDPEEPPSRPGAARLVRDRERVHRSLVIARTILHLLAGAALAIAIRLAERPPPLTIVFALALAVLVVALSESLARAIGDDLSEPAIERLAPALAAIALVAAPLVVLWETLGHRLRELLPPLRDEEDEEGDDAEELRQLVTGAPPPDEERDGPREQAMLHGVFSLGEIEVKDVMVPRVDIVGVEWDMPWADAVARVRSAEHARLPVYAETLDEIRGILYAKDLLPAVIAGEPPEGGWHALVRPAVFIPATKPLDTQLRDFQAEHTHIAIVVDEYGGTAGLVTIEDVLEEIFGEIRDEYDVEEPTIEQEEGRRFWVAGEVTLDELAELLDHEFDLEDVSTVGGLVYAALGRVPRPGEEFMLGPFRVIVEQVRRRRVKRVYFERAEALAGREEEN
ncbi:MAG TPA: hemolysin family protein [Gemmatimonadaceae bacterium]|nr:hemolysin family protein [Gemmatimonadaceae bacterium]